jgi:hypothetical protein
MVRSSQRPWQEFLSNPTRRQFLRVGGLTALGLSLPPVPAVLELIVLLLRDSAPTTKMPPPTLPAEL